MDELSRQSSTCRDWQGRMGISENFTKKVSQKYSFLMTLAKSECNEDRSVSGIIPHAESCGIDQKCLNCIFINNSDQGKK